LLTALDNRGRMLKTYRIIPLVFILFLFGFTLITVSPVIAQSTKDLEDRINRLEMEICEFREWHRLVLQQRVWNRHIHKYGLPELSLCSDIRDKRMKVEAQGEKERTNNFDKGPFTYSPNGSVRQSPDGKFRCIGFPKIRSWPECEEKFKEAKERTKRLFHSR
jgi:hypothetical protein